MSFRRRYASSPAAMQSPMLNAKLMVEKSNQGWVNLGRGWDQIMLMMVNCWGGLGASQKLSYTAALSLLVTGCGAVMSLRVVDQPYFLFSRRTIYDIQPIYALQAYLFDFLVHILRGSSCITAALHILCGFQLLWTFWNITSTSYEITARTAESRILIDRKSLVTERLFFVEALRRKWRTIKLVFINSDWKCLNTTPHLHSRTVLVFQ